jgi:hypothetical protein
LEKRIYRPTRNLRWKLALGRGEAVRILWGEWRMRAAAKRLLAFPAAPGAAPLPCTFMTGRKFWHQTAFCGHSLARQALRPVAAVIFDDGSLLPWQAERLRRLFPAGRIVGCAEAEAEVSRSLPPARFPHLHRTRRSAVLMRKLVDPRAASPGWQLFLDSDMLFFRRPEWLEQQAGRRAASIYMADVWDAYLRPLEQLDALCGRPLVRRLNSGIFACDDSRIDWERMEHWCGQLTPAEQRGHVVEQTLAAMLLAWIGPAEVAPPADYHLQAKYAAAPGGVTLCHYVESAKGAYFAGDWRRARAA